MKTQHNIRLPFLLIACIFLLNFNLLNAGERIDGNGTIITKQQTVAQFFAIEVETFCNVVVNSGSMPMVSLQVDENLQDIYQVKVENGVLKISTEKWPEPTQILLTVQVPFITEFTNSGWGKIKINDLVTQNFTLNASTGNVKLDGKVEQLTINASTGDINAKRMQAKQINLLQRSHGTTILGESNELNVSGNLGKVYYKGNPTLNKAATTKSLKLIPLDKKSTASTSKKSKLKYVNVKIRNNSLGWNSFVIRGPKQQAFSYGFSMFPYKIKNERIPVGTKFFSEKIFGGEKLLRVISANDENKTVNLFE